MADYHKAGLIMMTSNFVKDSSIDFGAAFFSLKMGEY